MIPTWKALNIIKGMLTSVPVLDAWRLKRAATGGSNSARYCYAVWLRHLVVLDRHGFSAKAAVVGELGPGDSIGTGFAALLSGAERYVGLDLVPYSNKADLRMILTQLAGMYSAREPIPNHDEFPNVRPRLPSYDYPANLVHSGGVANTVARISADLANGLHRGDCVRYSAPWVSVDDVAQGSLDLLFSQAVLQYLDNMDSAYRTMFAWLKPGGYCSHAVGLGAMHLSPFWNGHWAYSDLEWRLLRGRRQVVPNRQPLSAHLSAARGAGFDVVDVDPQLATNGLDISELAPRFRTLDPADLSTSGAMIVLRKPQRTAER